jgi:transcriptional/translational regulatory protein YebC/TACO1
MFDRKGVLVVDRDAVDIDEDDMLMIALEAGAEDIITQDDAYEIRTAPEDFALVRDALEKQGIPFISAQLELVPKVTVSPDVEAARKVLNLIDKLDDHDDVQNVYHNMEIPSELEELEE